MSRESVQVLGRAFAQGAFVDTILIERAGTPINNPSTGVPTIPYTTIYSGPGAVKMGAAQPTRRVHEVGEAALRFAALELRLPTTATGILSDDRVTIVNCVHDPELTGVKTFITGEHHQTWIVQRSPSMTQVLK
jgi:hypothetical protein